MMCDPVHDKFLASLGPSQAPVWAFAYFMHMTGHTFRMEPWSKAPTRKQYKKHSDNGDLYVWDPL